MVYILHLAKDPMASRSVRYPMPEEIFTHLSGRTGRIIKWLLTQPIQDAIGGRDNWKITINGKGDNVKTCLEIYTTLD